MMKILFGLIVCSLFSSSMHQMIGFGSCPQTKGSVKDFDLAQYSGTWFEQYRYFIEPEVGSDCTQVNITQSEDGSLEYLISFLDAWLNEYEFIKGTAKIEDPEGEGKFVVEFPDNFSISYRVVDTDHQSYSVVMSCENELDYYTRNLWIFTRDQYPPDETINKAIKALRRRKLPSKLLHKINHSNCSEAYPEFDPDAEYINDVELDNDAEEIALVRKI